MHISRHPSCPHPCTAVLVYPTGQGCSRVVRPILSLGRMIWGRARNSSAQVSGAWSRRKARDWSGHVPLAVGISCGEAWGWSRARGASEVGHLTGALPALVKGPQFSLSRQSHSLPFSRWLGTLFEEVVIKEQRKSPPLQGRHRFRLQEKWELICGR